MYKRQAYHYQKTGQSCAFRPLYRLDKDTSGVVLLGKNRISVSSAVIKKTYFAICEGTLSGSGTVDAPIGLKAGSKIVREAGHGERAVTHWNALYSRCLLYTSYIGSGPAEKMFVNLNLSDCKFLEIRKEKII